MILIKVLVLCLFKMVLIDCCWSSIFKAERVIKTRETPSPSFLPMDSIKVNETTQHEPLEELEQETSTPNDFETTTFYSTTDAVTTEQTTELYSEDGSTVSVNTETSNSIDEITTDTMALSVQQPTKYDETPISPLTMSEEDYEYEDIETEWIPGETIITYQ